MSKFWRLAGAAIVTACLPVLTAAAGLKHIGRIKPGANPPQYTAFSQPLSRDEQLHHALDRLTFGPRPGDLAALQTEGLKKWLTCQLHPERVPENPVLETKLAELPSLQLSIRQTYLEYPSPQAIAAAARGRGALPEDPELRATVQKLANQYLQKREDQAVTAPAGTTSGANTADDADLALRSKLSSVFSPAQIDLLQHGTPDWKRVLLASIPAEKQQDFAWALRPAERRSLVPLAPETLRRQLLLTLNPQGLVANDLSEGKLLRAIYSTHQLQELLVDFWFNHFNVSINKGSDHYYTPTYEREAIRPHVFGSFYDLLLATAESPAMLFYLDNWQSVAPDAASPAPVNATTQKRKPQRGLNENYGRELLELHTLGVNGGYKQKDVIEVARCFTGWTIAKPQKGAGFEYNDKVHDKGQKIVLGHLIPAGGGMSDGLAVLAVLARQPATAHFVSLKLARRFVADDPPPSLVNRMTASFLKTGGDLRQLVETMISSPEFWSRGAYQAKVKTPLEMVASAIRTTNTEVTSAFALANEVQKLGEPLYRKTEPTGYSSANTEWVSSSSLLERMNFALALAHNSVPGVHIDTANWQALLERDPIALARNILDTDPSGPTREAIGKALSSELLQHQLAQSSHSGPLQLPSLVAGLTLGAPEFQRR